MAFYLPIQKFTPEKRFDRKIMPKMSIAEYIRGYDIDGNEKLWIVTSGKVNSLAFVDFNSDGKNEVSKIKIKWKRRALMKFSDVSSFKIVCGCDNGTIKIYQNDSLLSEFFENSSVIQVSRIGK